MKHLFRIIVLLWASCIAVGQTCAPTTEIDRQSRTGMKHRSVGTQKVSARTTTVEQMLLDWPNPTHIDKKANTPIDPRESQAFTLKGDIWVAKVESNDCDLHVELSAPGNGQDADRVIVEIPQEFTQAQSALVQALRSRGLGDLRRKKSIKLNESIPIEVTGLAFFDAFHYSASNPKRGHGHGSALVGVLWELHPVFKISVPTSAPQPAIRALVAEDNDPPAVVPQEPTGPGGDQNFAFAISRSFLESLRAGGTILPTFNVTLGGHSKIHPLESDCEMHVAATLQGQDFGFPGGVVIEPPNLCQIDPNGDVSDEVDAWLSVFDDLQGKTCQASGFPRIFTEHVSGGSGASNPDHVFELHPAVSINCGGDNHSFASFIQIFPGMRAISPRTAASCIANRKLEVKYDPDQDRYLFRESPGTCGNFAQVAVESVLPGTVRNPAGGHSAIARVSADGESSTTLKIYTLSGTEIDGWLSGAAAPVGLHGIITYDYFAVIKKLHPQGQDWSKSTEWAEIPFPLAFVAFGESADQQAVPGEPQ